MSSEGTDRRLDGWKSIASFFGRDERTVKRWEASRGLPVHRIPGGGRASVWADPAELRNWIEGSGEAPDDQSQPSRRFAILGAGLLLAGAAGAGGLVWRRRRAVEERAPYDGDAVAQSLYRRAQLAWADRTPEGLAVAVGLLKQLITRRPKEAAGFAKLADCYLLLREFGVMSDAEAYAKAEAAARDALVLAPNDPAALRALAFVRFWGRGDATALDTFRRALASDPNSVQTRMWYANALSVRGRHAEALTQFRAARSAAAGDVALFADEAIARAAAGETSAAMDDLRAMLDLHPDSIPLYRAMASAALRERDAATFLAASQSEARLRRDDTRLAVLDAASQVLRRSGPPAFFEAMARSEVEAAGAGRGSLVAAANLFAIANNPQAARGALARARKLNDPGLIMTPCLPEIRDLA